MIAVSIVANPEAIAFSWTYIADHLKPDAVPHVIAKVGREFVCLSSGKTLLESLRSPT